MAETKIPYTHLMYMRKYNITNNYDLFVVGVNTTDIFHTIGEYYYRSETHVKRIDFVKCTQAKLDFWKEKGYEIYTFKDKYIAQNERK